MVISKHCLKYLHHIDYFYFNLGPKINLGPEINLGSRNKFGSQIKCGFRKNLGSKQNLGPKKSLGPVISFGPKPFGPIWNHRLDPSRPCKNLWTIQNISGQQYTLLQETFKTLQDSSQDHTDPSGSIKTNSDT